MGNITLNDYTNTVKVSIGGPKLPPSTIMMVSRNFGTSQINGNKLTLTSANIINTYPKGVIVSTNKSVQSQSGPVIKVKSMNVQGPTKTNISSVCASSNIYSTWKQSALVITSVTDKITQLTNDVVTLVPTVKESGINDIRLQLVSGKYCEIRLGKSTLVGVSTIDFLPSSLEFDENKCTIKGMPFVAGISQCTVNMPDDTVVRLTLEVIPLSLSSGI